MNNYRRNDYKKVVERLLEGGLKVVENWLKDG